MKEFVERPQKYLATVLEMLRAFGENDAAAIVREGTARVQESHYDNWNGGTTYWDVYIQIEPAIFARIGEKRTELQGVIETQLGEVLRQYTNDRFSVSFVPIVREGGMTTVFSGAVSKKTRKNIVDGLVIEKVKWYGRLDDVAFLNRVFELQRLPSSDGRYDDAAADIWQHRVNNDDWPDEWIYSDQRFNLLGIETQTFLHFLCELVHPTVRDREEATRLVSHFNDQLRSDGWEIIEAERIAGRPRFIARKIGDHSGRSITRARAVADVLDAAQMKKQIERLEDAVENDPALAIGTAKELVETTGKAILIGHGVPIPPKADMPVLTKALLKELRLLPEGIADSVRGADAIKNILRSLSMITHGTAELRGLYGTGHGHDGQHRGLEPRHARLVVGAAIAFIEFVVETFKKAQAHPKAETEAQSSTKQQS